MSASSSGSLEVSPPQLMLRRRRGSVGAEGAGVGVSAYVLLKGEVSMPSQGCACGGVQLARLSRPVGSTPGRAVEPMVQVERLAWEAQRGSAAGVHQQQNSAELHPE